MVQDNLPTSNNPHTVDYFLPRDAMHKRGLYRRVVSVRLSVCHARGLC